MSAVMPTKRLFDPDPKKQLAYVDSRNTDLAVSFAKWRQSHEEPTTAESYQRDVLAEARARKVKK